MSITTNKAVWLRNMLIPINKTLRVHIGQRGESQAQAKISISYWDLTEGYVTPLITEFKLNSIPVQMEPPGGRSVGTRALGRSATRWPSPWCPTASTPMTSCLTWTPSTQLMTVSQFQDVINNNNVLIKLKWREICNTFCVFPLHWNGRKALEYEKTGSPGSKSRNTLRGWLQRSC